MKARDQRKRSRRKEPFRRRLHFSEEEVWTYRIGGHLVLIRTPDLETTFHVPLTQITGMTPDDLERGEWKGWWKGVGPQEVKDYIQHHLRPAPEIELPPRVIVRVSPWRTRGQTWHLRRECHFLPQKTEHILFNAWKQVRTLSPEEAAERLGEPLTRRNLCGVCMHRVHVKKEAS